MGPRDVEADRFLLPAGLAGALSLLFASASLTIAIISAARPPVSAYGNAALNDAMASQTRWAWLIPAAAVLLSLLAVAQVVVRRPLLTTRALAADPAPLSPFRWRMFTMLATFVLAMALLSIWHAMQSIRLDRGRAITDNGAFAGLSTTLGVLANITAVYSLTVFHRWWGRSIGRVDPLELMRHKI